MQVGKAPRVIHDPGHIVGVLLRPPHPLDKVKVRWEDEAGGHRDVVPAQHIWAQLGPWVEVVTAGAGHT